MTRLLISTAFAGLLALGGAAWAQGNDDHGDRGRGRDQQAAPKEQPAPRIGGQNGRGYNPGPPPAARNAPAAPSAPTPNAARGPAANNGPPNNDRRDADNNRRGPTVGGTAARGPENDRRGFDNNGRGPTVGGNGRPDARRDFSAFHRNFSAPRRFRAPVYQRPRGWYAQRWAYGEFLPQLFWTQNYWLDDFMDFGLDPPPPGTVWVRDGQDAILIDRFSGEIIEVAYGVFY